MKYRIGQRVRLLHQSGDGVVTGLIDNHHVEVDMGDNFPIDVHIDEVIPVDRAEGKYLTPEYQEDVQDRQTEHSISGNLYELSMVIIPGVEDKLRFLIVNPEPVEILFTCYAKIKHKYMGLFCGRLSSGKWQEMFIWPEAELAHTKAFIFQTLIFTPGKGMPHSPYIQELSWNRNRLKEPSKMIDSLGTNGWIFSLREAQETAIETELKENPLILKPSDRPERKQKVVDLHIEELVDNAHMLAPSDMLKIQLNKAKSVISEALMENCSSLVLIHGIGEGTLRKEVRKILAGTEHIAKYENADLSKYGNGATIAFFE